MAGPIEFRDSSLNFEQVYSEEIDKAEEFEQKASGILKKIKVGEGGFFGFFVYLMSDKPFVENQIAFWKREVAPIKLDLANALKEIQALRTKLEKKEISEREKTTLLEQEREFIITQRKLTALKIVVVERMRDLPSLKPIISKTFQSREEFDRRHEDLISEIAKVQKLLTICGSLATN